VQNGSVDLVAVLGHGRPHAREGLEIALQVAMEWWIH
jgi:hypothetical protein